MMSASADRLSVFIVENSLALRTRLAQFLHDIRGVTVVGQADSPQAAVDGILRTRPDWVVLDIHLAGGSGIEVLRAVHPQAPEVRFIVLSNYLYPQYRKAYLEAGASYFLDKHGELAKIGSLIANRPTGHSDAEP